MRNFINKVVKPYGPMIKTLKPVRRRVAVLSSEASRTYPASPRYSSSHYDNYQVYEFYILLNMIHVPADVIFDETVTKYGLEDYDMLVLPKCGTLTKSVYDKIVAFEKQGGLVVSDQYLRASINNVIHFDFNFMHPTFPPNASIKINSFIFDIQFETTYV